MEKKRSSSASNNLNQNKDVLNEIYKPYIKYIYNKMTDPDHGKPPYMNPFILASDDEYLDCKILGKYPRFLKDRQFNPILYKEKERYINKEEDKYEFKYEILMPSNIEDFINYIVDNYEKFPNARTVRKYLDEEIINVGLTHVKKYTYQKVTEELQNILSMLQMGAEEIIDELSNKIASLEYDIKSEINYSRKQTLIKQQDRMKRMVEISRKLLENDLEKIKFAVLNTINSTFRIFNQILADYIPRYIIARNIGFIIGWYKGMLRNIRKDKKLSDEDKNKAYELVKHDFKIALSIALTPVIEAMNIYQSFNIELIDDEILVETPIFATVISTASLRQFKQYVENEYMNY